MHLVLSQTSPAPLYEQIVNQIRQAILTGNLAAGEALPSLRQLAADLKVSLITTTRAYNELSAAGLIINHPGRGSIVAPVDCTALKEQLRRNLDETLDSAIKTARDLDVYSLEELISLLKQKWNNNDQPPRKCFSSKRTFNGLHHE